MDIHALRDFIFERLADPIAELGCAGPPECRFLDCGSKGEHDTGLSMMAGVIEVMIDDQEYEIRVTKKTTGA